MLREPEQLPVAYDRSAPAAYNSALTCVARHKRAALTSQAPLDSPDSIPVGILLLRWMKVRSCGFPVPYRKLVFLKRPLERPFRSAQLSFSHNFRSAE